MSPRNHSTASPGKVILFSTIATICIGSLLLSCAWAQNEPLSLLDCFFTATSATCVTGLLTVPIHAFSVYGQAVILALMQIGAIGFVTLTFFFLSLFLNLGLTSDIITGEVLEIHGSRRPRDVVFFIIIFTLIVEGIGLLIMLPACQQIFPNWSHALFVALFQSVSAFCNAGFSIFPEQTTYLTAHPSISAITAFLVFIGGLGFIAWQEILCFARPKPARKLCKISLHTKIALLATIFLVGFLSLIIFLLEYAPHANTDSFSGACFALFNGICLRSAGFTTLDFAVIHPATVLVVLIISFIGSSPGSTGGGIKTTTFAVLFSAIKSTLARKSTVEMKGKTIPNNQVFKAMAIFTLSLLWIAMIIFTLLITDPTWRFLDILSEVFAAFTTLGVCTGSTAALSATGKFLIIFSMIVGRIGSLTLLLAFKKQQIRTGLHYPEERILIG